ncbi:transposase [Streptomyces sp. HK10]|uniref:transposase n=1 Tax=Streptomyces sp. HK10 TaxID=3373255 RepID=UPI003749B578
MAGALPPTPAGGLLAQCSCFNPDLCPLPPLDLHHRKSATTMRCADGTFMKDDKVASLGTTLLDSEQYSAAELVALYRQRWEIELAFDEIKNHFGPNEVLQRGHERVTGRAA